VQNKKKENWCAQSTGSQCKGIVQLLSKDFLNISGHRYRNCKPVSWWTMHKWLQRLCTGSISVGGCSHWQAALPSYCMITVSFRQEEARGREPGGRV
jgi:hypothetical protein